MTDLKQRLRSTAVSLGEPSIDLECVVDDARRADRFRRSSTLVLTFVVTAVAGSLVAQGFIDHGRPPLDGIAGIRNGPIAFAVGAYEGTGEDSAISLVDPTTGQTISTFAGGHTYDPSAWSPDGSRLAFWRPSESGRVGDMDIWTIAADGTDPRQLTHDPAGDYGPMWSPDGTRILFFRNLTEGQDDHPEGRDNAVPELMVMAADGSDPEHVGGANGVVIFTARWSPDGNRILTVSDDAPQEEGNPLSLAVVKSDGTDRRVLVEGYLNEVQWATDGSEIYFASEGTIWAVRVNDGTVRAITGELDVQGLSRVVASPDGETLAFTRPIERERREELWIVGTDGSEPTLVADRLEWREPDPAWSPDGASIAFVQEGDIWTLALANGEMTRVTTGPAVEVLPAWGRSSA